MSDIKVWKRGRLYPKKHRKARAERMRNGDLLIYKQATGELMYAYAANEWTSFATT